MRKYNIAINEKTYEVGVEEVGTTLTGRGYIRPASAPTAAPASAPTTAPASAPTTAPAPAAATPAPTPPPAVPVSAPAAEKTSKAPSANGKAEIKAGVAGRVFKLETTVGQTIKKGDVIMVLEAMKMEIPILASEDGIIADIKVAVGDSVETGQTLVTLK